MEYKEDDDLSGYEGEPIEKEENMQKLLQIFLNQDKHILADARDITEIYKHGFRRAWEYLNSSA